MIPQNEIQSLLHVYGEYVHVRMSFIYSVICHEPIVESEY